MAVAMSSLFPFHDSRVILQIVCHAPLIVPSVQFFFDNGAKKDKRRKGNGIYFS